MEGTIEQSKQTKRKSVMTSSQDFGRLEGKVDGIKEDVGEMKKELFGNGKDGLIKISIQHTSDIEAMTKAIADLAGICKGNNPSSWIMRNWQKIFIILLVIHSLIPKEFDLWALITKLF